MAAGSVHSAAEGQCRTVAVGRGTLAFAGETFLQRMHDQRTDQTGIAETDLSLGRMNIDVDFFERNIQK